MVLWFLGSLVSWFIGFLFFRFLDFGFIGSWFLVSKFQNFKVSNMFIILLEDIGPILLNVISMLSGRY